jgi:hypothetical protein
MNSDNLDNLANIKQVEVPDFLFAQIQQKIEQSKKEELSKSGAMLLLLSFCLLLGLNIFAVIDFKNSENNIKTQTNFMFLNANNYLY